MQAPDGLSVETGSAAAPAAALTVTTDGRVGIGTPEPKHRLHVVELGGQGFNDQVPIVAQGSNTVFGAIDPDGVPRLAINLIQDGSAYRVDLRA